MKQITITVPDNCELKQEGNNYTIVKKVEKEKKLTYHDIVKELFFTESFHFYLDSSGYIEKIKNSSTNYALENNATSEKQAQKLLAINKLMNVAKYFNGGWQPNWDYQYEKKYYIYVENEQIRITYTNTIQYNNIYFKLIEFAKQAVEILGKETIKLALCTDY